MDNKCTDFDIIPRLHQVCTRSSRRGSAAKKPDFLRRWLGVVFAPASHGLSIERTKQGTRNASRDPSSPPTPPLCPRQYPILQVKIHRQVVRRVLPAVDRVQPRYPPEGEFSQSSAPSGSGQRPPWFRWLVGMDKAHKMATSCFCAARAHQMMFPANKRPHLHCVPSRWRLFPQPHSPARTSSSPPEKSAALMAATQKRRARLELIGAVCGCLKAYYSKGVLQCSGGEPPSAWLPGRVRWPSDPDILFFDEPFVQPFGLQAAQGFFEKRTSRTSTGGPGKTFGLTSPTSCRGDGLMVGQDRGH